MRESLHDRASGSVRPTLSANQCQIPLLLWFWLIGQILSFTLVSTGYLFRYTEDK